MVVYDYVQEAWTLYTGHFSMAEQAEDSAGANLLITGDYHGNIYKLDETLSFDLFDNTASAIPLSYTTGWLHQEMPDFNKAYKYLYVFTQVQSTASITAFAGYDYDNTYESSVDIALNNAGALYDVALYDVDTYASFGYHTDRFELNREAKAIKLKFVSNNLGSSTNIVGWTIVYQNVDFKE